MARRRPNAFEVSFPEEAHSVSPALTSLAPISEQPEHPRSITPLKRKSESQGLDDHVGRGVREAKRVQLPPPAFYEDRGGDLETAELVITGEDPFVREDQADNENEQGNGGGGEAPEKPTRVLTDFSIYDSSHGNEMVLLTSIEEDDGVDRKFEAAGYVFSYIELEEDDEELEYVEEDIEAEWKYVHLGTVLRYTFDFTQKNSPVHIETPFAWYILRVPSKTYEPLYQHFLTPRKIAQMVVSSSFRNSRENFEDFLRRFEQTVDPFGRTYKEEHIWDSMSEIQQAVAINEDAQRLKTAPLVRHILRRAPTNTQTRPTLRRGASETRTSRGPPAIGSLLGNPDLAVLKPENQPPCHVTPFIASLARGVVHEEIIVVGSRPPPESKALKEAQKNAARKLLCEMLGKARQQKKRVDAKREDFVGRRKRYLKAVTVGRALFQIGDFVIIPIDFGRIGSQYVPPSHLPANVDEIPATSTLADYFWFAKVLYGDIDTGMFHVQWLQHSSQTMLQQFGHPQELFFNDICDHVPFGAVTGKITVYEGSEPSPEADFFVKFMYNANSAAYTSIDPERQFFTQRPPPGNCVVCPLVEKHDQDRSDYLLKDAQGVIVGVAYGGHRYHHEDFVLYRAEKGPAHIGYITGFNYRPILKENVRTEVYLQRVGRISSLGHVLPDGMLKDERQLFLTDEWATVGLGDLIQVCFVFHPTSIPNIKRWLALSPYHFYMHYWFPTMTVRSWNQHRLLSLTELNVCRSCTEAKLKELGDTEQFLAEARRKPLRVLDIFGGVGAFSMGLVEGSGCLQLTDLIEISPSAAKTAMRNFPAAAIHNQCANMVLRYSIKEKSGQRPNALKQIFDDNVTLSTLEKPDIIVAGVPCQSHSALNMYKRADDNRNNSILTALSYLDHLRPSLFYFENVPGFLDFSFDSVQTSIHKVEGGLPMGGLKFLISALLAMRYQVRFGLLQAGHYGTPQRRYRFLLVAAVDGHPLPDLPKPSHDFPADNRLIVKLPTGDTIRSFLISAGTAPHPTVSIDDAISDLPRFDWKHPQFHQQSAAKQSELRRRSRDVPALPCRPGSTHCGYSGEVEYHHMPKTTYQASARIKPSKNLQHFTRTLLSKKVERVISIPLVPNADYRDLRPDQLEWQVSNPLSSVAKKNYRPGLYGRLDQTGIFPTTVTNIDPTAKQSRVLNPYCHRMVTVRELARSQGFPDHFVFEALGHNIITMHRQIGNAVPLPIGAALGRELRNARFKKWLMDRKHAGDIDMDNLYL